MLLCVMKEGVAAAAQSQTDGPALQHEAKNVNTVRCLDKGIWRLLLLLLLLLPHGAKQGVLQGSRNKQLSNELLGLFCVIEEAYACCCCCCRTEPSKGSCKAASTGQMFWVREKTMFYSCCCFCCMLSYCSPYMALSW
jgi:hypothetical protein